jgi:hypothetical protein
VLKYNQEWKHVLIAKPFFLELAKNAKNSGRKIHAQLSYELTQRGYEGITEKEFLK